MKRAIRNTFLIFLSLGFFVSVKTEHVSSVSSTIIKVPDDYATIQEAINASALGNIIYIYNGTYHEHLEINKSVSLVGQSPDITIIDGDGLGTIIHISTENASISGFTIRNGEIGIHLQNCSNANVKENVITSNFFDGIRITSSQNITIKDNNIEKISQNCVFLQNSDHSLLDHNNITSNSRWSQGILLYYSNNNIFSCNTVRGAAPEGNEGGIGLLYSNNNTVNKNFIINNNWCGISLRRSNNTIVYGNTIVKHNWFGIRLGYSYNSQIHHNNFIDNYYQASVESANATWDSACLGNYWSNYVGFDNDSDGIGDTSYQIDNVNIDKFPLMGKFYSFLVSKEGEMIQVWIISNSTISDFKFLTYFDSETAKNVSIMKFNVIGNADNIGFCRMEIPHELLRGPYVVTVDGLPPIMVKEIISNATQTTLYFTYNYSSKQVILVPEFPLVFFPLLFTLISLLSIAINKTNKLKRTSRNSFQLAFVHLAREFKLILLQNRKLQ